MRDFTANNLHRLIGCDDGLILEIGANEGDSTADFVAQMPRALIRCFEPDPRAVAKFKARKFPDNVRLYEVALSDKIGTAEFHQSDGRPPGKCWEGYGNHWDKSGSLLENHRHTKYARWLSFLPPIRVPTTTLDTWAGEHLPTDAVLDFAWVDVQGAEALVLAGGQETVKRLRYWYCECDPRPLYRGMAKKQDIVALLPGFEFVEEFGGYNFLFKNTRFP